MAKKNKSVEELLDEAIVKEDVPYEVPENWVNVKLGYVGTWGSGGTPSRKHPEYYDGNIPWIKTGELNNGYIFDTEEKITAEAVKKSSAKLFPKDSVVLAMYGATIGKVAILGVDATTNQACAVAKCYEQVLNNKYLFYYLKSQKENFIELGKGGAQPNISQTVIKEYPIMLPPLKEQGRIVERIESLFEKLDKSLELIQEAREGFDTRKAAVLEKAFRGELTNNMRNSICYTFVEREKILTDEEQVYAKVLPKSWGLKRIENFAKVKGGKRLPKGEILLKENTGYPYLKAGNLKNNTVIEDNLEYLSEAVREQIKNYTISSEDVYITNVGACIGDVGVVPEHLSGANLTENAAKICDIGSDVDKRFLMKWLSSVKGQFFIKGNILSATLGNLELEK